MTGQEALVGIDVGTTACKAVVFAPDGAVLGIARAQVPILRGTRGEVTCDMDAVWTAVSDVTRRAVTAAGHVTVTGVGVTGQGDGAWLLDAAHRPVGPAALWLDARAASDIDDWERRGWSDAMKSATGSFPFPGSLPMLVEHLKTHEPALLDAAAHHLNCKDWIRLRMTGTVATDATDASRTYLDTRTGAYSSQLMQRLGHEDMAAKLAPLRPAHDIAGTVTPEASAELGIPAGTPVVVGMMDTVAGGVGLGAIAAGDTFVVLGTTAFVGTIIPSADHAASTQSMILATGLGSEALECMSPMNGMPNLDWARDVLGWSDLPWSQIEARAQSAPPGSGGVVFLPYVATAGERAPFIDPDAAAGWAGARVTTTPETLMRSVYESVAYAVAECLDHLNPSPGPVRICGGGAASDLLCAIIASASGREVIRVLDGEVGARGVAALAMAGISGIEITEAVARMAGPAERINPDPSLTDIYAKARRAFAEARDGMRTAWTVLAQLRETTPLTTPAVPKETS